MLISRCIRRWSTVSCSKHDCQVKKRTGYSDGLAQCCFTVLLEKLRHSPSFPCVDRRQGQEGEEGMGNGGEGDNTNMETGVSLQVPDPSNLIHCQSS